MDAGTRTGADSQQVPARGILLNGSPMQHLKAQKRNGTDLSKLGNWNCALEDFAQFSMDQRY